MEKVPIIVANTFGKCWPVFFIVITCQHSNKHSKYQHTSSTFSPISKFLCKSDVLQHLIKALIPGGRVNKNIDPFIA